MNSVNSPEIKPQDVGWSPGSGALFPGNHTLFPDHVAPVPVVTATLSLLLGTVVCCSFSWSAHLSVHLAVPSTAADSHCGSLTRWVLLPSCFTGEETGAERGQENAPR